MRCLEGGKEGKDSEYTRQTQHKYSTGKGLSTHPGCVSNGWVCLVFRQFNSMTAIPPGKGREGKGRKKKRERRQWGRGVKDDADDDVQEIWRRMGHGMW